MSGTFRRFLALAWRNLWRNSKRTSITLIVVATGMWSVLFFNSFMIAWMDSSKDATLSLLIGEAQIHAPGFMDDPNVDALMEPPAAALTRALSSPEISAWSARLNLPGVVQSEYKTLPVTIMGVDPTAEALVSRIPASVTEGRYLSGLTDDGVVIGQNLAERLKTGLGRRVILMSQNLDGTLSEQSFDVIGLYDVDKGTEDFFVFTGRAAMAAFVGTGEQTAEIVARIPDPLALAATVAGLQQAAPDLDIRSWKEMSAFLASTDTYMAGFIFVWLGVVFSLMAIGIVNTQLMAVFERNHEFGLLRALGMKPRLVLLMVSLESAMMIGLGVLIGMVLAALTIAAMVPGVDLSAFAQALEMFQGGQVLYPDYQWPSFALFGAIIWGLGILVALWPARRAARLSPVEAMRHAT